MDKATVYEIVKVLENLRNSIWVTEDLESDYDCGRRAAEKDFIEKIDGCIAQLQEAVQ